MSPVILSLLALCLVNSVYSDDGVTWALLVAGSNEYYNYRHQADVCHAYQVLHAHGIPDERIVVMMYDDIAKNTENPTKNIIINRPDGPDVYANVLKDYTKKTVTPKNFLNVLQGNQAELVGVGSGKVINSGPNDNIFVFFADHGAPGIVAFPDGSSLKASNLNKALKNMYTNKKYKNMVIYIEACESGSMFDGLLPPNINVYATTASNPDESSYACYFDETRNTYLGDVYSVMWMEDSDKEDLSKETLLSQFQIVKKNTNTSHVMEYGNLTISSIEFVGEFQGNLTSKSASGYKSDFEKILKGAIPSESVRISILNKKLEKESDPVKRRSIVSELENVTQQFRVAKTLLHELPSIVYSNNIERVRKVLDNRFKLTDHECYENAVDYLTSKCFDLRNDQVLRNLYVVVNLCENKVNVEKIKQAVDIVCEQYGKIMKK